MIKNLFRRKPNLKDFSLLQVDMHSHLAAGIDDGAKDDEESLYLLKKMSHLGYSKLIVTPHIMDMYYPNTPEIIKTSIRKLQNMTKNHNIDIKIEYAAEYLMDEGFKHLLHNKQIMTFGENYVLVELTFYNEPFNLFELIFEMQTKGYQPILAHPERYLYFYENLGKIQELKNRGVFLQLDLLSLIGEYSNKAKKMAKRLIEKDMYDFVGTDCHNKRYADLYKKVLKNKLFYKLMQSDKLLNTSLL